MSNMLLWLYITINGLSFMLATPVTSNWTLQEKIIIFPQNFTIVLFAKLGEKKDINIAGIASYTVIEAIINHLKYEDIIIKS